ncbi:sulfotransferase domain-containing protein [Tundrisphaera lichenicola]|uniref:sulfotransferase domain-containing protein n=1 Tax=Tundrisphaera lichenicola TaxID=2029860 RepID=UPI003EBF51C7
MYVFCVGMYRACSTWQYEVVAHLLERHRGGRRLGYLTGDQFEELEDRGPDDGTWKVLKSHEEHNRFALALAQGRAFGVYAHRDVRDVAYSLMHKRKLGFGSLVTQGMVHQVLANDRFWTAQPRTISQRYDRLVEDPATGVEGLAAHLGIDLEPGESARVASEYSFEANRKRTIDLGRKLEQGGVDLDDPSIAQAHDRQTLLHWNHMREGRVGDWRERATPHERAVLARTCGRWLVDHGYEPDDPGAIALARSGEPGGVLNALRRELAMARGAVACRLRCLSLRHPRLARSVKPLLGIAPEAPLAQPAPVASPAEH